MAMRYLHVAALAFCLIPAGASAQKPRDLKQLDPCKILTSADLATATKGKVSSSVGGGAGAAACMWVIDAPSGAGTYQLFLQEPKVIEALFSLKTANDKATKMPGLWTDAYITPPGSSGDQYILTVLNRGDMAIEVHGVNKDAVISLAKLAMARLK
jgi:hypothetical protein